MSSDQVLDILRRSAQGGTTAIRAITKLEPAGGKGDKVLPPTYKDSAGKESVYAFEKRKINGKEVETVLLDSVQSQANRMEEALLEAHRSGKITLPVFEIRIPNHEPVTSLTAPHRIHDAILRDSLLDGKPFRESDAGKRLVASRAWNATAFYEYAPTALLFGTWDSQSGSGTNSAKVARSLVSEIMALDVVRGVKTSSRIDPLGIRLVRDVISASEKPGEMWKFLPAVVDAKSADNKKTKKSDSAKGMKPSEINHGNVMPTITGENGPGGVTFQEALQTVVLSFTQLRRLRFPTKDGTALPERDAAGRAVLAALGLCAVTFVWEEGLQLRSRCQLVPVERPFFEVLGRTASEHEPLIVDPTTAIEVLNKALKEAEKHGLIWQAKTIPLEPRADLVQLVEYSDKTAEPVEGE